MLIRVRFLTAAWMILVAAAFTGQPTQGEESQFKTGDRLVTAERVDVQAGQSTAATLETGTPVTVADVKQGWVGITAEQTDRKSSAG